MKYELKVYTIWEYGQRTDAQGNPHQEDCTFPLPGDVKDTDRLFVLCDGMGGHDAGEVASSTVCQAMGNSVLALQPDAEGLFTPDMLQQAIADAFDALDDKDTGAAKKMGTTMTFLKLHDCGCTIAHMGDSRVYHIRPGKTAADTRILFQTRDHSLVNDLIAIGELTEEEAKHSRQKNVITRAMQPHMEHRPKADVYTTADIRPGDYFYLCSDGMLENMENPQICYNFSEVAGTDEEKVHRLTQATSENRDNHTAIIVHILEVTNPMKEEQPTPVRAKLKSVPIMAEVHDDEQEDAAGDANLDNEPVHPSAVQPDGKASRNQTFLRSFLISTLVTLVVAFGIVLYFLVFTKEKDEEKSRKEVPPVEVVQDEPEKEIPQHEQKTEVGAEQPTPVSPIETPKPNTTEQEPVSPVVSLPPSSDNEEETDVVKSDATKVKEAASAGTEP